MLTEPDLLVLRQAVTAEGALVSSRAAALVHRLGLHQLVTATPEPHGRLRLHATPAARELLVGVRDYNAGGHAVASLNKKLAACPRCRKPIVPVNRYGKPKLYCSRRCKNHAHCAKAWPRRRDKQNAEARAQRADLNARAPLRDCETCGTPFCRHPDPRRPEPRWCSRRCQMVARNRKDQA